MSVGTEQVGGALVIVLDAASVEGAEVVTETGSIAEFRTGLVTGTFELEVGQGRPWLLQVWFFP